jgi:lactoylglutathione lyase
MGSAATTALVPAKQDAPAGVETGIRFRTHDAGADSTKLRSSGMDAGDVPRWPGAPPIFVLRDQDGNRLEFIEQTASGTA